MTLNLNPCRGIPHAYCMSLLSHVQYGGCREMAPPGTAGSLDKVCVSVEKMYKGTIPTVHLVQVKINTHPTLRMKTVVPPAVNLFLFMGCAHIVGVVHFKHMYCYVSSTVQMQSLQ